LRTAFVRDGVLKPREQGDWGERSAALWLLSQGALVFIPFGHSPDIDLITILEDRAVRVQVKNCSHWRQNRWECLLCTRGGNQSWSGIVKRLDPSRYDYLFVVVADGRRWWIPSAALEVGTRLRLGGPQVRRLRGRSRTADPWRQSSRLGRPSGGFRSGQTGSAVNRVAQPSEVRILLPPSKPLDGRVRTNSDTAGTFCSGRAESARPSPVVASRDFSLRASPLWAPPE
jgi:PD-(D/E)XK endonuclease